MKIANFEIGGSKKFFLMSGPCVIESEQMAMDTAGYLTEVTKELGINFVYKSSFDKANRTSIDSFRGLGIDKGLQILSKVKKTYNIPIVTDVHENTPFAEVAEVVDILQTPAFLCRQTDFILNVCKQNKAVNIKKGQFLSPWDMQHVVAKAKSTGNKNIMVCERGVSFGYNNLVSDMRSLEIMKSINCPVVFDATHSVQLPGGQGNFSGGQREFVSVLARASVAVGIDGLFMETHPNPDKAKSDGPNSFPMHEIKDLLKLLKEIDYLVKT